MIMDPIRTAMTEDADLLKLVQWLSPAFPVGGYAYSQGLEWAIGDELIVDANSLGEWLKAVLREGAGRADAVLLALTLRPNSDITHIASWARALAASQERWRETSEQGAAFSRADAALCGQELKEVPLPVAVGRAAARLSIDPARIVAVYLQAMISNLVTGAVRHIPLGQSDGQRVLGALHPAILETAAFAVTAEIDDIASATPGADLAAIHHETQDVRIFRT